MPEIAGLPLEIVKRTMRLNALFETAMLGELSRLDLTKAEYEILATLRRNGAPFRMRPTDLQVSSTLSSGGTSNVLRRMMNSGLVIRVAHPEDGRSSWVQLTERGIEVAEIAVRRSVRAQAELLESVPKRMSRSIARTLREVLLALGDTPTPDFVRSVDPEQGEEAEDE